MRIPLPFQNFVDRKQFQIKNILNLDLFVKFASFCNLLLTENENMDKMCCREHSVYSKSAKIKFLI